MLKSILSLLIVATLTSCNFSDKAGERKFAPVIGQVKRMVSMFEYQNNSNIRSIYLVGTNNGWDKTADPFDLNTDRDVWELDVKLVTGLYDYKFLIHYKNGHKDWSLDPNNPVSMVDAGGYTNSVIYIGPRGSRARYVAETDHLFSIKIDDEKVSNVYLSGNFNKWDKTRDDEYKLALNKETGAWEIRLTMVPGVYFYKFISYTRNTNRIYKWYNDPKTSFMNLVDDDNGGLKDRIVISPWEIAPLSDALIYYCIDNDDDSITSVTMKIVDTLNHNTPKELYSFYMELNSENNCYEKNRLILPTGRYEYKFVVATSRGNERWIHDPKSNSLEVVADPYEEGAYNSLLTVGPALPSEFTFSFDASGFENVQGVYLVGDFNDWDNDKDRMTFNAETRKWELTVNLTRAKYGYKFRIERTNESEFLYPQFKNDLFSREAREDDTYGYHSVITVE